MDIPRQFINFETLYPIQNWKKNLWIADVELNIWNMVSNNRTPPNIWWLLKDMLYYYFDETTINYSVFFMWLLLFIIHIRLFSQLSFDIFSLSLSHKDVWQCPHNGAYKIVSSTNKSFRHHGTAGYWVQVTLLMGMV